MHDLHERAESPSLHALCNPIHPSVIDQLDPAFVKLYNANIANGPPMSTDLEVVRQNYSALYAYATAPATGVGGIGETQVPGWDKYPADINVRVYVPPGEEPGKRKVWPVHFNFHGGGKTERLQAHGLGRHGTKQTD
jgi:acetyl esterase/lipase